MSIRKISMLAVIGLILSVSVSATTIQSDGNPTINSKVFIDSHFDFTERESQKTLVDVNDTVFNIVSVSERRPDFNLLITSGYQANRSISFNIAKIAVAKHHEVGWRI